jgi:hypothetical protein
MTVVETVHEKNASGRSLSSHERFFEPRRTDGTQGAIDGAPQPSAALPARQLESETGTPTPQQSIHVVPTGRTAGFQARPTAVHRLSAPVA